MEFVFGLIGLLVSIGVLTLMPYMVYGNWRDAKRALNRQFDDDGGILGLIYIVMGLLLALTIFITLCACNNTFWHLDYLTTEGIWEK